MDLIFRHSTLKTKERILSQSPEMEPFFDKLEKRILNNPEYGLPDSCLLADGKTIICLKQSIEIHLFSGKMRYGRSQLTAQYIFNENTISIFNLYFST